MSSPTTVLMTSISETPMPSEAGMTVTRISVSGDRHLAAGIEATVDAYPRPDDVAGLLASLVGQPVTFMRSGENMLGAPLITAATGRLFQGSAGVAYMPKGARTKGYRIDPATVLDVVPGLNKEPELARRLAACRARFPTLAPLTQETLDALPEDGRDGGCTLGVFGRWALPDAVGHDAVWLIHSYQRGEDGTDDIVEGVLYVRPDVGESEHGSVFGRDLLHVGGVIVDCPVIPFAQAIEMTSWDHDRILEAVRAAGA